ncbi:MAG: hypothetical protein HWN65_01150 [Candidatus Helarchaeota archaeon]|nr:hypothetical protein [Candidatus Helarchaeota archaeon]
MKRNQKNCLASLFLISLIVISTFTPLFDTNLVKSKDQSSFDNYPLDIAYDNYCYLTDLNQTDYFFNATGACYVLAEVNGTDFTSFQLDNETLEVSYGLNVFPKYFGANYTSHNLTFRQSDIDNNNLKWVTVEPLFIKDEEITVNLTGFYSVSFNASGPIAILMQLNFSLNWLYLEVDSTVINDIYNTSDYPELDSAFYSYFAEKGGYLSFDLNMDPGEHTMRVMGNGSIAYKIFPSFDWDQDLISDVEEVQQEVFIPRLGPATPNIWGFFEKSSEIAYFENYSRIYPGYFTFYIPDSYQGAKYLYISVKSGTISDIIVNNDDLTLQNVTISSSCKTTPYGRLSSGYHTIMYNYNTTEYTEISFHIDGEKIIIFDKMEMRDTDGDGLKDILERKSGLNVYDSDTDSDGLPDTYDPSPLAALTLDKDYIYQFIIPANYSKDTFINVKIQRPNPDYSTSKKRIYLEGHSHQPEGLDVFIYPVLRVFGNQTIHRNNIYWRNSSAVQSYSLVEGYDAVSFGDAIPDTNNTNAEFTFKIAKQSAEVFEFDLVYPKGHLAKNDSIIDLRFDILWLVVYNSSGTMTPLHYYAFEQDIILQSLTLKEVEDVNYILASPDSMIENQILWALTQNPQLGSPTDFNVQDDIVGMGSVSYLDLANQILIDRNNTKKASNETEVMYISGLQSNYDVLNKIHLQTLTNPSFEVNHSGEFTSCFSFYSISDVYNANYTLEDEEIRGKNKICYLVNWNNYSNGGVVDYSQKASLIAFPIFMQVITLPNSTILKIDEAIGSEIPLNEVPYSTAIPIYDKIIFRNQTYIEPSDSSQSIPLVNFNNSKHVFKESIDNRQWQVEASGLIFNNYSGRPLSHNFIESSTNFRDAILNLESTISQIPGLFFNFDTEWYKKSDTSSKLQNLDGVIEYINSKIGEQLANLLPTLDTSYTIELKNFWLDKTPLDHIVAISVAFVQELNIPLPSKEELTAGETNNRILSTLNGIALVVQHGAEFLRHFSDSLEIMNELIEGEYSIFEEEFWQRITCSVGHSFLEGLSATSGLLLIAGDLEFDKGFKTLARYVPGAIKVVNVFLTIKELKDDITDAVNTYGDSPELYIEVAWILTGAFITFAVPILLEAAGITGGISLLIAGILIFAYVTLDYFKKASKEATYPAPPPSVQIVWADEEGHPGTQFDFRPRDQIKYVGSYEIYDAMICDMVFHNVGDVRIGFDIAIGIPAFDGSVTYTVFGGGWWIDPDCYSEFRWITGMLEASPNLTLSLHITQSYYFYHNGTTKEIYNEEHLLKLYIQVLPKTIAGFYLLTSAAPEPSPPPASPSVLLNTSELIEIVPLVGNTSVILPILSVGYTNPLVKYEISLNESNFYVDTPNITQNLDSDLSFTLYSQNFYHPGGLYYMNITIKLNATDEQIFSDLVPFRLQFIRNFTYTQSNLIYHQEVNQYYSSSNIADQVNLSSLNLSVGDILFVRYTPNCTKETYLNLRNDTELIKRHLIIPRGNRNFTEQFATIFIDENITINQINLSSGILSSEFILLQEIFIINASLQPPENQTFTPFNFTNEGNVPEYVKFSFSGVPFTAVNPSLHPDEFTDNYQLVCVMPGEHRECTFNISKPTAISNLYSRSIIAHNPLLDSIISRYTDYLAIEEIYIDTPENRTYTIYDRETNPGLWLNIIPEADLVWSAYSLDGQSPVNFSKNVYIPLPADGSHYLQVFGNDTLNTSYQSERRYFTLDSCLINFTSPANNSLHLNLWTGVYNATYGFEQDYNGTTPAGWDVSGDVPVVFYEDGHTKVLEMGDADKIICRDAFPQTSGTIEFWLKFKVEPMCADWIYITAQTDTPFWPDILEILLFNGAFYYYNNMSHMVPIPNIARPEKNVWHHMRIDFRCYNATPYLGLSEDRFVVTFDGVSSGELIHYHLGRTEYELFEIYVPDSSPYLTLWIDAIGFSWDPNYDVGDNLNEKDPYVLPLAYELPPHVNNLQYSLNGQGLKPILGPDIITFNETGDQTIQLFGSDIYGDVYESRINSFAVSAVHIPTPAGVNVIISEDEYTGIQLNYTQVSSNGTTTISLVHVDNLPPLPGYFYLGPYNHKHNTTVVTHFCYNISMSSFHSLTFLRIPYDEGNVKYSEKNLRLFELDQFNTWNNRTLTIDTVNNCIYGQTNSVYNCQYAILEILDTVPAYTRALFDGIQVINYWEFTAPVNISYRVLYELTGVYGYNYSFDNVSWTTYTGPFIVANEYNLRFWYYSWDVCGNVEKIRDYRITIDWTPPTTTHSIDDYINQDGEIYVCPLSILTLETTDNLDEHATIYYRIDGGDYIEITHSNEIRLSSLSYGTHTVEYYAVDKLGNIEAVQSFTIHYISQREFGWKKIEPTIITLVITAGLIGLAALGIFILVKKFR